MDLRPALDLICARALEAVDPYRAVSEVLAARGGKLLGGRPTVVLAFGKAAVPMAQAAVEFLGDRLEAGLVITKDGHGGRVAGVDVLEASHPEPDSRGCAAAERALALLESTLTPAKALLVLVSGGGSALFPVPASGLSLGDKQRATHELLRSGASIHEINGVRKHLSRVKGGRLLDCTGGAPLTALFLSDVVGDEFSCIASGPTAPDPTTYQDCIDIVSRYRLSGRLPPAVMSHLEQGRRGAIGETPKPGDPRFKGVSNLVVATNYTALQSAAQTASEAGLEPLILTSFLEGSTADAAAALVAIARQVIASGEPVRSPCCLIAGGETTVRVTGAGTGGRNMEFALQAAARIDGWPTPLLIASLASDGTDGPTDAAGAVATPDTVARSRALGLSIRQAMKDNASYAFFKALDDLIITGPTRTNVMDIHLLLLGR